MTVLGQSECDSTTCKPKILYEKDHIHFSMLVNVIALKLKVCTSEGHGPHPHSHSYIKSAAQCESGKKYFLAHYFPKETAIIFVICEIHLFYLE